MRATVAAPPKMRKLLTKTARVCLTIQVGMLVSRPDAFNFKVPFMSLSISNSNSGKKICRDTDSCIRRSKGRRRGAKSTPRAENGLELLAAFGGQLNARIFVNSAKLVTVLINFTIDWIHHQQLDESSGISVECLVTTFVLLSVVPPVILMQINKQVEWLEIIFFDLLKGPGARGEFHLVPNSYLQKGGTYLLAHDQACNCALCSGKFQYVDLD